MLGLIDCSGRQIIASEWPGVSLRSPAYSGIDESTALETFSLPAVPEGNFRTAVADFGRLSGYPEPLAAGCSKQRQLLFYLDTSAVVSVPSVCATPTTAGRGGAWENGSTAQILIKPMSELGPSRHINRAPLTSGPTL
jgi:hypothetical protein